jgi:MFS family permease
LGLANSILLIGWATGGIIFGIMGDRIGRAKTMFWTILAYSVFTGLSAFSYTVYDFILYRFLTGLGVGGQFAVGVSLVAEVMPDRARPRALGMLQAFSAVGNITAGLIGMTFSTLAAASVVSSGWRWMFAIGILPALLSVVVISRLREPERWKEAVAEKGRKQAGSLKEMFGTPRWRRRAIVGVVLASSGVIGLWAIGVYSSDLVNFLFRQRYHNEARVAGQANLDQQFVCAVIQRPDLLDKAKVKVQPADLLSLTDTDRDPAGLYAAALALAEEGKTVTAQTVLAEAARTAKEPLPAEDLARKAEYLRGETPPGFDAEKAAGEIEIREKKIKGDAGWWTSANLLLFNIGAFFGIYLFSAVTQRIGRRSAFAIAFLAAMASTVFTFLYLNDWTDIFWMTPIMGACQLSVFGGYAIYFPELFPTRMRATGTSVCYNIARYVAAAGPLALFQLKTQVFGGFPEPIPFRYAGVTMCAVFLLGIAVLPFAPETKGQPLPE